MSFLTNLNENQNKAVMSNSPYLRIIAGAGSGKTATVGGLVFPPAIARSIQ